MVRAFEIKAGETLAHRPDALRRAMLSLRARRNRRAPGAGQRVDARADRRWADCDGRACEKATCSRRRLAMRAGRAVAAFPCTSAANVMRDHRGPAALLVQRRHGRRDVSGRPKIPTAWACGWPVRSSNVSRELLTEGVSLGAIQVPRERPADHHVRGASDHRRVSQDRQRDLGRSCRQWGNYGRATRCGSKRVSMARALGTVAGTGGAALFIDLNCDMGELEDGPVKRRDAVHHVRQRGLRRTRGIGRDHGAHRSGWRDYRGQSGRTSRISRSREFRPRGDAAAPRRRSRTRFLRRSSGWSVASADTDARETARRSLQCGGQEARSGGGDRRWRGAGTTGDAGGTGRIEDAGGVARARLPRGCRSIRRPPL